MDRDQADRRRASLRASDADREQFVEALRQHHVEGRLTAEELAERTGRAYAARTFGDLDALAADLPPIHQPGGPPAGWDRSADLPRRMRPAGPRRAAAKANLVRSVLWFALVSVVLIVVWALTNFGGYFWPVWPILGFMLAIAWQIFYVYYGPARFDDDHPRGR
jgi:uncharacterized protein DUF1707/2TM domain-containing protein